MRAPDGDTRELEAQLVAGRPQLGGAFDGLRARVLAGVASRSRRSIGRYLLGRSIGSGAFGTVYEADDPELRRKVAIKLFTSGAAAHNERVLREARALATLSSPHVVHVFEVGVVDDGTAAPYLVMELVDGPTWRAHLTTAKPHWRETVAVGIAAARGLAAAHRAGVVHRDFKPDNLILAIDGRPRVVDFGLARAVGDDTDASHASLSDHREPTLTPTGHVLGTPAYMAPEAFTGPCTPRSDQYSLCVSLFEALFGVRPFQVRTTEELVRKVGSEDPVVPAERRGVPPAVIAAVMRGLRRDPAARHHDLDALVASLERAQRSRLGMPLALAGLGAAAAIAIAVSSRDRNGCITSDAVWTRMHGGDATLDAQRERYAQRWRATEQSVCAASPDAPISAAARHCLDRRLDEVAAVGELIAGLDPEARAQLGDPFADLRAPEDCTASPSAQTRAHVVVDPGAVAHVQGALAQLYAHLVLAQYGDALTLSTRLLADARAAEYPPLVVEVAHAHARALLLTSQYAEAAMAFEETFHAAQAAGLDRDAAGAASELLRTHAGYLGDATAARRWAEHAETSFARMGDDPSTHGVYAEGMAALRLQEGDAAGAAEALRDAISAAADRGAARAGMTGGLHNRLAVVLLQLDRLAEAAEASATAAEIFAETNGEDSPPRASALSNEGVALGRLGRHEEALARHREALAIREAVLAADHLDLAASRGNMAEVLERLGRHDEAIGYIERALEVFERRLGTDHPNVAIGLDIRGRILGHGDAEARALAQADFMRAARIYDAAGLGEAASEQRAQAEAVVQEQGR
jgi:tetratricopeptide (TPR) repeat protein